jgi:acetyl-CoA carboxylase biotin carboxyl carrier protein
VPDEVNLEQVKKLVKLVEKHGLSELVVEEDGVTITVKGASAESPAPAAVQPPQPVVTYEIMEAEVAVTEPEATPEDRNLVKIEATMIGVFYRTPSPDAPSFIDVGDTIEVGQTIGLIEAMKVFSEIPSEVAGEVVAVCAENGQLVQQGETLVVVRVPEETHEAGH